MDCIELKNTKHLKGEITIPADKSISHRAVMFASLAKGKSIVRNFLKAEDPLSTVNIFRMLGIEIDEIKTNDLIINGKGMHGLKEPFDVINCGNSGTTARLMSGMLAGNPFFSVITGDSSLRQRPMARVVNPLKEMGAYISGRDGNKYLPIAIKGGGLKAINYSMPVASAQVKSCLTLAGLYADGTTVITEPSKSRDHTERMLQSMGAGIDVDGLSVKINDGSNLKAIDITIPSDFSSAAFFIAAAVLVPNSEVIIKGVGINPTRTGFLEVIKDMGADINLENIRNVSGEPVADIYCKTAEKLKSVKVSGDIMPLMIDEFPILCVLATQADGITEIRGANELRMKESDRIKAMASELRKLGVELEEYPDGIAIRGKTVLKGCNVESYGDHRAAMSLSVAALIAEDSTTVSNASCVNISFPGFYGALKGLTSIK